MTAPKPTTAGHTPGALSGGTGQAETWHVDDLAAVLEAGERELDAALDSAGALDFPEPDWEAVLDPFTGMPLRERLRARAHALGRDLAELHGAEADDLAGRLRGFLAVLDATTPGSEADPTTTPTSTPTPSRARPGPAATAREERRHDERDDDNPRACQRRRDGSRLSPRRRAPTGRPAR